ncbi:MAG: hypothetical protein K2X86_02850 [Cytophagaceae bacterium]|nr:hypothetical protein [Cytophagaceae bacterium]
MRFLSLILLLFILFSCSRKDEKLIFDPGAKLEFSADTVFFDTIFTSVESVTHRLLVFNRNKNAVNISSIELGGKASSSYSIIINGKESFYESDFYLRGGDSIFILVKIKEDIDPQNQSLPYLVTDSLLFNTNGNIQKVDLVAYGQDATFLKGVTVPCDTVWTNQKPFVVTDFIRVPPGCTLTLQQGVKVLFHDNAYLKVEGTLLVTGDKDSLVTFSGDKLNDNLANLPGQWQGIIFEANSKNNSFDFAVIKNAVTGIKINNDPGDADTIAEVKIFNTIVKNMQKAGVEALGTDVYAYNSLFTNCVTQTFAGLGGGNYHFKHCTFASYSYSFFREESAIKFSNQEGGLSSSLKARFTNCILWGDMANELVLSDNGSSSFDFASFASILKTTRSDQNVNGNIINTDPKFVKPVSQDFHLNTVSPAIDAGQNVLIATDLDGKARDANPDMGAYEK